MNDDPSRGHRGSRADRLRRLCVSEAGKAGDNKKAQYYTFVHGILFPFTYTRGDFRHSGIFIGIIGIQERYFEQGTLAEDLMLAEGPEIGL